MWVDYSSQLWITILNDGATRNDGECLQWKSRKSVREARNIHNFYKELSFLVANNANPARAPLLFHLAADLPPLHLRLRHTSASRRSCNVSFSKLNFLKIKSKTKFKNIEIFSFSAWPDDAEKLWVTSVWAVTTTGNCSWAHSDSRGRKNVWKLTTMFSIVLEMSLSIWHSASITLETHASRLGGNKREQRVKTRRHIVKADRL